MQDQAKKYYTVDEYLAFEEISTVKDEYHNGSIFPMSGASINHNRIVGNLFTQLYLFLMDRDCEVFMSDMRISVENASFLSYPDIVIVCQSPDFYQDRNDTITNPLIIFEVLSESKKNYDRGEKFMFYRMLPAFKEYLLIDQYQPHIEHYVKMKPGQWVMTEFNEMNELLELKNIPYQIKLTELYRNVNFGKLEPLHRYQTK